MISIQTKKLSTGFTLIEILVAMTIGLFLMGGVIQLFTGMNTSVRLQDQMGYVQENGRLAIELLSKEIRTADYWGCSDVARVASVIDPAGTGYADALHGGPQTTPGLAGADNTGLSGSDSITLRGARNFGDVIVTADDNTTQTLTLSGNDVVKIVQDQIMMIGDCRSAEIFQVTNEPSATDLTARYQIGTSNPGNGVGFNQAIAAQCGGDRNCFKKDYNNTGAVLLVPYSFRFYIDEGASGLPALFMSNNSNCPGGCELIEGVENMQILYGEDTSVSNNAATNSLPNEPLTVDRYVTAAVANMNNVVSVKISLLLRTELETGSGSQKVTFNEVETNHVDGLLRKVFTSTITLRNRM